MNKLTALTLGLVLAGTALIAAADTSDREKLTLCDTHVNEVLGQGTRTKLYGIQHRRNGDRLRLKVYPTDGDSRIVRCWIDNDGVVSLQTTDGVALTGLTYDGTERVSLSE